MPLSWLGRPSKQSIADLWAYQAIITDTQPDVVIELGAGQGGTALYLVSVCAVLGRGHVVTVDRSRTHHDGYRPVTVEDRLHWMLGDFSDLTIFDRIRAFAAPEAVGGYPAVMLLHDGEHEELTVLRDLELYARLVTPGCYVVVCDTNLEGPSRATRAFCVAHPDFVVDRSRELEGTWNPGGYLKRVTA